MARRLCDPPAQDATSNTPGRRVPTAGDGCGLADCRLRIKHEDAAFGRSLRHLRRTSRRAGRSTRLRLTDRRLRRPRSLWLTDSVPRGLLRLRLFVRGPRRRRLTDLARNVLGFFGRKPVQRFKLDSILLRAFVAAGNGIVAAGVARKSLRVAHGAQPFAEGRTYNTCRAFSEVWPLHTPAHFRKLGCSSPSARFSFRGSLSASGCEAAAALDAIRAQRGDAPIAIAHSGLRVFRGFAFRGPTLSARSQFYADLCRLRLPRSPRPRVLRGFFDLPNDVRVTHNGFAADAAQNPIRRARACDSSRARAASRA